MNEHELKKQIFKQFLQSKEGEKWRADIKKTVQAIQTHKPEDPKPKPTPDELDKLNGFGG